MRRLAAVLLACLAFAAGSCSSQGGSEGANRPAGPGAPLTGTTAAAKPLGGGGPLANAKTYTGLTQTHVDGPIRYRQTPPVGGDHNPIWQDCGAYGQAVNAPNGVHAMEHGAVWITYRPSLPKAQVKVLTGLVPANPYLLVSPWYDDALPAPVVLTAWGVQLGVQTATDPAVKAFVGRFEQGPQTPEPGATCSGGIGTPDITSRAPVG
jgi:hypothetical protein